MVVNARTVLHLNQTAAEYAYYYINGWSDELAAEEMEKRYRVSREQAHADYKDLADRIHELIRTPDLDPVTFLGFERTHPTCRRPFRPAAPGLCPYLPTSWDHESEAAPAGKGEERIDHRRMAAYPG